VYGEAIRKHDRSLIEPDPLPSSLAARRAATREEAHRVIPRDAASGPRGDRSGGAG
jgi:hypothetical protein